MAEQILLQGTQVLTPSQPTIYDLIVVKPLDTFSVDNEVTLCIDTREASAEVNLPALNTLEGASFTININPSFGSPNPVIVKCDAKDEIITNAGMTQTFIIESFDQPKFVQFVSGGEWRAS